MYNIKHPLKLIKGCYVDCYFTLQMDILLMQTVIIFNQMVKKLNHHIFDYMTDIEILFH